MRRRQRSQQNAVAAAAPGSPADPDRAASDDHLPPLRLDLDNDDTDTFDVPIMQGGDGGRPWWRWAGFGMALLVGVVGGVIGANARQDAQEHARIELIGGHVDIEDIRAEGQPPDAWRAEFVIFNSGGQDVAVTGFDVPGWSVVEDDEATEPSITEPGTWTSISARITPDCQGEPPDVESAGSFTANASIRTGTTEASVPVSFGQAHNWLHDAWIFACSTGDTRFPDFLLQLTQVVSTTLDDDKLLTLLRLMPTPRKDAPDPPAGAVVQMWTTTPGLEATALDLPIELFENELAGSEIMVEWTITSCAELENVQDVQLNVHVAADVSDSSARMQIVSVPAQALIELGRLSAQTCGL